MSLPKEKYIMRKLIESKVRKAIREQYNFDYDDDETVDEVAYDLREFLGDYNLLKRILKRTDRQTQQKFSQMDIEGSPEDVLDALLDYLSTSQKYHILNAICRDTGHQSDWGDSDYAD